MGAPVSPKRTVLLLVNAVLVLLAAWNLLDLRRQPFVGYQEEPSHRITRIDAGSPAQQAGLAVGDQLVSVGGVAVTDTRAEMRRGRPGIGESRPIEVQRAGQPVTATLTYSGLPAKQWTNGALTLLVGLCFGLFGLMSFLRSGSRQSLLFAAAAACFGYLFVGPPYLAAYATRTVLLATVMPVVSLGFAALLHFLLGFPKPRPFLSRPGAMTILYAPAAAISLLWLYLFTVQPDSTSGMNTFVQICFTVILGGYALVSAWVMARTYLRASDAERSASGLNLMLLGVIVGFVPLIIMLLMYAVAPTVNLPGGDYYFLCMVAIPVTFATALARHERAAAPSEEAPAATTV